MLQEREVGISTFSGHSVGDTDKFCWQLGHYLREAVVASELESFLSNLLNALFQILFPEIKDVRIGFRRSWLSNPYPQKPPHTSFCLYWTLFAASGGQIGGKFAIGDLLERTIDFKTDCDTPPQLEEEKALVQKVVPLMAEVFRKMEWKVTIAPYLIKEEVATA